MSKLILRELKDLRQQTRDRKLFLLVGAKNCFRCWCLPWLLASLGDWCLAILVQVPIRGTQYSGRGERRRPGHRQHTHSSYQCGEHKIKVGIRTHGPRFCYHCRVAEANEDMTLILRFWSLSLTSFSIKGDPNVLSSIWIYVCMLLCYVINLDRRIGLLCSFNGKQKCY